MSAEEKDLSEELIREAENIANATSTEESTQESSEKDSTQTPQETSELDSIKAELIAAQDRNLRLMAEFDNFRRRTAKEQLDIIETANAKLLEKLSEVLDNFERAFATENKANDLEAFEKGMQLIHSQFAKTLTDAGLEQIDPIGQEFDPNCQEALMQQPSEEIPEGHVVTVFQKGYRLKGKILKTAKPKLSF